MTYTTRTIVAAALALACLAPITFTPDTGVGAQGCHKDCGSYTNQELRDSGNYLGPATPNAHVGNVYEY